MKSFCVSLLLGCAAVLSPQAASASAITASVVAPVVAEVPFDPPLDRDLRYRWQKDVTKDGKLDSSWSVYRLRFSRNGEDFRLVVNQEDSGTNRTDPVVIATRRRLAELLNRPIVLDVNADAVITGMDDADTYWATGFSVLRQELSKSTKDEATGKALHALLSSFEAMEPAARLAYLTEELQPVLEFAATATEKGKPLSGEYDTATPFGVTAKQHFTIELIGKSDQEAVIQTRSSLPEAELNKTVAAAMRQVAAAGGDKKGGPDLSSLKFERYVQESTATHRVSLTTGLLNSYRLISRLEVKADGQTSKRDEVRTISILP